MSCVECFLIILLFWKFFKDVRRDGRLFINMKYKKIMLGIFIFNKELNIENLVDS